MMKPTVVPLVVDSKYCLTNTEEFHCTCLVLVHVAFDSFLTDYESFRKLDCKNSVSCSSYLQSYKLL